MSTAKPINWLDLLIDDLKHERPPNHGSILRVAAVLATIASSRTGTLDAYQNRIEFECGLTDKPIREVLAWLDERGWLRFDRRIAKGGYRYVLTVASVGLSPDLAPPQNRTQSGTKRGSVPESVPESLPDSVRTYSYSDSLRGGGGGESTTGDEAGLDSKDKSSDSGEQRATTDKKPSAREVAEVRRWLDDLQEVAETAEEEGTVYGWRNFPFDRVQRDEPKLVAEMIRLRSWGDLGELSISDRWHSPPAAEKINHPARWLAHFLNRFPDEPEQATG